MSNGSAVTVNLFNSLPFDMVKDLDSHLHAGLL